MADCNRNALRSRRLIRDAYIALQLGGQKSRYTVADICREADINRSTFYAHYDNFDDLEQSLFQEYLAGFASWLEDTLANDFLNKPLPHLNSLGNYIDENKSLMNAFMIAGVRHDSGYGFGMAVRAALLPVLGDVDTQRLLRFDFFCSALTSVYFTWLVESYKDVSLDELNETIASIISIT